MSPFASIFFWITLTRLGILLLTALLSWITYRSHLLLKEFQPDFNLLLSPPELAGRLVLIGICLFLAWMSGLPAAQLGLIVDSPWQTLGLGVLIGLVTLIFVNLVTTSSINRFGRHIYSPLVVKNILPRRPVEWGLTVVALLPAVLMEELLFRTLWLGVFGDVINLFWLIIGTSILFGLMHKPQGQLGTMLAGGINVLFCVLFVWSGQLLLPLSAHYTLNLVQLVVAHRQRDWLESYER